VAELALDDVESNALMSEFERMRVAQLVRRKAAPDPARGHRCVTYGSCDAEAGPVA
jgi:hypothetical protein